MAARCLTSTMARMRSGRLAMPLPSLLDGSFRRSFSSSADDGGEMQVALDSAEAIGAFHLDTSNLWPIFRGPASLVSTLLDSIHAATGAPWWAVLAGSTIAVRTALLPLTVIQLQKTAKLAQLWGKLRPPVHTSEGSVSLAEQLKLYAQKRKELDAPSPAWFFSSFFVQAPIFITWIVTVRNMAIKKYPGFDTGGALWFTDLTVPVSGDLGALLPMALCVVYILNVEVSFAGFQPKPGMMGSVISIYSWWLRFCVIPICISGFYLPQGVFMYWLPNSLFSLAQTLCLRTSYVRKALGLPVVKQATIPISESDTLIKIAAEHVARNDRDAAIECLNVALEKDPENATAYFALGKLHTEASEWDEGISMLTQAASKAKDPKLQISAYLTLGIAHYKQGKIQEAITTLKSVANAEEPQDAHGRQKYNVALVTLASLLCQNGEKLAALEYLERAAKYDPKVGEMYVDQIKKELAQAFLTCYLDRKETSDGFFNANQVKLRA